MPPNRLQIICYKNNNIQVIQYENYELEKKDIIEMNSMSFGRLISHVNQNKELLSISFSITNVIS